jgi:3-phenylpropionate/trans-cinnamate dioxygenase ferredoxin reductase subunit
MSAPETVVVVGAGQGGVQIAASLREEGFGGEIILVGEEPGLPYHRPPLSKAYLTGKSDADSLSLRAEDFYRERRIQRRPGVRVEAIDRTSRRVRLSTGANLGYDHLVLATGARNRALPVPGAELDGVLQLRTLQDAEAIRQRLGDARHIVVVGAGFIGLEVAAVAAERRVGVTVVEATGRPMSRALSLPMSEFFRQAHERSGIRLECGAVVMRIIGENGRAAGVQTADGRVFPADLVLVAIGIVPNVELAANAGLAVGNGIIVDEYLLTEDPALSAIGDCAIYPSVFAAGGPIRLESVQNTVDHARCVGARIAGRAAPYTAMPWFWSDQGPLKLQIAGVPAAHRMAVLRGDPASGAFSVFCFDDGRLASVESVNKPADHVAARRLIAGIPLTPDEAADPAFDLKSRAQSVPVVAGTAGTWIGSARKRS